MDHAVTVSDIIQIIGGIALGVGGLIAVLSIFADDDEAD